MMIDRLARLAASGEWSSDLNPAQAAALRYLAHANRFSRSPSMVAEYLGTTRGTASQTLKALQRKGFVTEGSGTGDKRSISYDVTGAGQAILAALGGGIEADALDPQLQRRLAKALEALLTSEVQRRGGRSFGLCSTCQHHQRNKSGAFCQLLNVLLEPVEAEQICHEHSIAT